MKNSLRMTVAAAALTFGFSGSASAHPALALLIAPQVIQYLPQILPIFGGIFSGGGSIFNGGAPTAALEIPSDTHTHHRSHSRHLENPGN